MSGVGKRKRKLEIYVDGSFKDGNGGIGIYIEANGKFYQQKRMRIDKCVDAFEVEAIAVVRGVEYAKGKASPTMTTVYTDSLNVVKKLEGMLNEIEVRWIPREQNKAHEMSVRGRLTNKQRKLYIKMKAKRLSREIKSRTRDAVRVSNNKG